MLSDRSYMRDSYNSRPSFPALTWLICVIAAGYVIENIFIRWFDLSAQFFHFAALTADGIKTGFAWTLITSALIHNPQQIFHLLFTLFSLYVFGRLVAQEIGQKRVLAVFITSVVFGGLGWLSVTLLQNTFGDIHYGASAGVSGLLVLLGFLSPNLPIAPYGIDVGLTAKRLAIGMLVIDVLGLVLLEIPGHSSWFAMSHSAHLGGMFGAWIFYELVLKREWFTFGGNARIELPAWFRKSRKKTAAVPTAYKVNISSSQPDNMRAEIDRILDKINSDGFQSLTAEEKRRLDAARNHLSRR